MIGLFRQFQGAFPVMNTAKFALALLGGASIVVLASSRAETRTPAQDARPAWEYRVVSIVGEAVEAGGDFDQIAEAIETKLNEFGRDGWEFASQDSGIVILKRPGVD
jgi:hypothetical protein